MAMGILMERYTLTQEHAFRFLVRTSQAGNIKLRDLAMSIVTGSEEVAVAGADDA